MTRRSRWLVLGLVVCLGGAGAILAYTLAGGPWAVVGAVIGAVTGSFAPMAYDGLVRLGSRRDAWRGTIERPVPRSWARLLDPRLEVVGFVGREHELHGLQAWCLGDSAGRLRLITGPGGVGKTRLAVELADRMRKVGWKADRVADGEEGHAIPVLRGAHSGHALLVLDYAETRGGLDQFVSDLAGERGDGLRVLLLARSAGDWWDRLGIEDLAAWDMLQAARKSTIELSPVVSAELSDVEVVALAVHSFARELHLRTRVVEIVGPARPRRVLDLHAAALVAVLDETDNQTVSLEIGDVLAELLRHEEHYWYDSARACGLADGQAGATLGQLRKLVAAASLLGAATEDEAHALAKRVPGMAPSAKIAEWLRNLYPPETGSPAWIGSLQPDRLAELHAVSELAASRGMAEACLTGLDERQALQAVMLLARAVSDYQDAEELLRRTLPAVTDVIAAAQTSAETLTVILNAIPYPTVIMAPAAVALGQRIVSVLPDDAEPAIRAYWHFALGIWLTQLGRHADALPATEKAVTIYRELADVSPGRYGSDLASSLSNLGITFSELGRPDDALDAEQEATAIRRHLVTADPARHRSGLADSLSNLAIRFSELGHPGDALSPTEEAMAIRRELAASNPEQHRPGLAQTLSNLGITLSELGRPRDALLPATEAVAIYRDLAAASPDRYQPDLADSLSNLGVRLSEVGRPTDALPITQEAVGMYRDLVTVNLARYRPELARSLSNLGLTLSELRRPADALAMEEEAVAIRRELAAASPARYRPELARSLNNLGKLFSELDHPADAVKAEQEAVAIRRELAAANPSKHSRDLADSLANLGATLSDLDRPADALAAEQEAIAILRHLAAASPDMHRPGLAQALSNLGVTLSELGRYAEALPPAEEAVAICRELAVANPDMHRADLARSVRNLGVTLSKLGRYAEALPPTEEAAKIYRELATSMPDRYRRDFADSLRRQAGVKEQLGHKADAVLLRGEAKQIEAGIS